MEKPISTALLFINGEPPKSLVHRFENYVVIACTDGAYHYLNDSDVPLQYIIGDLDSLEISRVNKPVSIIEIPDQNTTDFDKALHFLIEKGITDVDVYGACGQEHDHFLGNLSTALCLKSKLKIRFYDEYSCFYFTEKQEVIQTRIGAVVSLLPFPRAEDVVSKGLLYSLIHEDLEMGVRVGTRNTAVVDEVLLSYSKGELLVFVGN